MSKQSSEPVEDFLAEDPEISSQKVVLLSFLSPEKILANKDQFFFQEFLKHYEVSWRTTKLEAWLAGEIQELNAKLDRLAGRLESRDASGAAPVAEAVAAAKEIRDNTLNVERLVRNFKDYVASATKDIKTHKLKEEFDDFVFAEGSKLEEEFFAKNEFRTTIRGVKIRGVFPTEAEAAARAKRLQKSDPNFNIYMGAVGKWMAWEPDPNKVTTQEYANEQLNSLMKKYRENEEARDQFYNERRDDLSKEKPVKKITQQVSEGAADTAAAPAAAEESMFGSSARVGDNTFAGMFGGESGDLAIRRKQERTG